MPGVDYTDYKKHKWPITIVKGGFTRRNNKKGLEIPVKSRYTGIIATMNCHRGWLL